MTDIYKQLDSSDFPAGPFGIADDLVAFVETLWTDDPNCRYSAAVYERPITGYGSPLRRCGHEHRDPEVAITCARRLLRALTNERRREAAR
jgi:hypothetical protein